MMRLVSVKVSRTLSAMNLSFFTRCPPRSRSPFLSQALIVGKRGLEAVGLVIQPIGIGVIELARRRAITAARVVVPAAGQMDQ